MLDDVRCYGNESKLTQCFHPGIGLENCEASELAGAVCIGIIYILTRQMLHSVLRPVESFHNAFFPINRQLACETGIVIFALLFGRISVQSKSHFEAAVNQIHYHHAIPQVGPLLMASVGCSLYWQLYSKSMFIYRTRSDLHCRGAGRRSPRWKQVHTARSGRDLPSPSLGTGVRRPLGLQRCHSCLQPTRLYLQR